MFLVLPKDAAQADETPKWQYLASAILILVTSLFALQVGVSAELPALPKEVLDFLASPEALQGTLPPGNFDVVQYVISLKEYKHTHTYIHTYVYIYVHQTDLPSCPSNENRERERERESFVPTVNLLFLCMRSTGLLPMPFQ